MMNKSFLIGLFVASVLIATIENSALPAADTVTIAGQCPALPPDTSGLCVQLCSTDEDCSSGRKCCSNGCGHYCANVTSVINVTHAGSCPVQSPDTIGICVEQCSSDGDCAVYQKCCSNGCGHVCQNVTSAIHSGSCPVLPLGTIGTCVEQCSNDGDCGLEQKCCSNGCGHVCQNATSVISVTHPGSCPVLPPGTIGICVEQCSSDGDCAANQKCCSNGCGHVCQNASSVIHPGSCPVLPPGTIGICVEQCSSDEDCAGYQKCCSNGCGHVCRNATSVISVTHPGSCPVLPPGTIGICVEQCSNDGDCGLEQKCCSNGCGHVCQNVTSVISVTHPGSCPVLSPGTIGICVEQCSSDGDCAADQKCCSNGCGNVCKNVTSVPCNQVACKCPYGTIWSKDQNGCDVCTCNNPCSNVTCGLGKICKPKKSSCTTGTSNCSEYTGVCVKVCIMCMMFCPYGNVYDDTGCPLCKCQKNPCNGVVCPNGSKCFIKDSGCLTYSSTCPSKIGVCSSIGIATDVLDNNNYLL